MLFSTRNCWPALLLLLAIAAGCRGPLARIPGNPLARDTEADFIRYGQTPAQKIAELRELSENITSYSVEEREQIAQALSQQLLEEDDPRMRKELTRALGYTPTQASTSALLTALTDPAVEVRLAACEALARQQNTSTIPALGRALEQDEDIDVRLAAARALGAFRDPRAVAALGSTLEERDPALRNRGLLALQQASDADLGMDVAAWKAHVETVVASLQSEDTSMASLPTTESQIPPYTPPASGVPPGSAPADGVPPSGGYTPGGGTSWPVQPASQEQSIYGQ